MGTNGESSERPDLRIVKCEINDDEEIIAELEVSTGSEFEDEEEEDENSQKYIKEPVYTLNDHDYFSQRALKTVGVCPDSLPRLEILEQPCSLIRFRYLSELQGTPHGPLTGVSSIKSLRTFPTVKLHNWVGEAMIRCWLTEAGPETTRPHIHDLVVRQGKSTINYEPHYRVVTRANKYTAKFENLVIIRTAKKEGRDKYYRKKRAFQSSVVELETEGLKVPGRDAIEIATLYNSIDKNTVCLFFEAVKILDNRIKRLCCVKSHPIRNLKDPESSELKITRCSRNKGSCEGGDEILIFVKKIPKDIKIEFFEREESGDMIWMDYGKFRLSDIHYDCAIAFWTPRYRRKLEYGTKAEVFFRLYRIGDKAYSNEVSFTYLPHDFLVPPVKKQKCEIKKEDVPQQNSMAPDSTTQASTSPTPGSFVFKSRKVPAILKNSATGSRSGDLMKS